MSITLSQYKDRDRVLLVEKGRLHNAVSFSRASTATYFNGVGVLVTATTNVPRFAYDILGNYLGLHVEEARTNRALRSRDMTNATWVKSNITPAQTATGLDGVSNSATQLTATAANSTSLQTITDATSRARAVSFDIKRVSGSGNVDITADNGTTWTTCTGLSTSLFTRYTVLVTNANPIIGIRIVASGDVIIVDYAQCEDGASATSRIGTTTATVTRIGDVCKVTTLSNIRFNAAEGSFVCKAVQGTWAASPQTYFSLYGVAGTRIQVRRETKTTVNLALIFDASVVQSSFSQTAGDNGLSVKMAMGYKLNDIVGSANGLAVSTDTSATIPTVTTLEIGSFTGGNTTNGYIEYLAYYPKKRPNVEFSSLSV